MDVQLNKMYRFRPSVEVSIRPHWLTALALGLLVLGGCAGADKTGHDSSEDAAKTSEAGTTLRQTHENLHPVLWMQRSGEYHAACLQTFAQARVALDRALADPTWTAALEQEPPFEEKPVALIVDVDETVLDNTSFEVGLIRTGQFYGSDTWDPWCYEARATPVPGALEFCQYAAEKRVAVFYVTNRKDHLREATKENLKALGFPIIADSRECVITRSDVSDKGPRRAALAEDYRILLMAGDNLGDFLSDTKQDNATRVQMVEDQASYWGERWFLLPNPVYGDWEGALFDFDYSITDEEELRRKHEQLID